MSSVEELPETRLWCSLEFREEAIRRVRDSDEPLSRIAGERVVSAENLCDCVTQNNIGAGECEGLTTEERGELRHLKREVKVLRRGKKV